MITLYFILLLILSLILISGIIRTILTPKNNFIDVIFYVLFIDVLLNIFDAVIENIDFD